MALLLYYVKLCASFQIHWWIQTGFTFQKRSIWVEIGDILSRVPFLEIWWMTLENNRAPLIYYTKLCASFKSHRWSQTWVIVRKRSSRVKIGDFFVLCDLEIWWMTLKKNWASLLYYIMLCASFQSHEWIKSRVSVQKRSIRVKIGNFLTHATL